MGWNELKWYTIPWITAPPSELCTSCSNVDAKIYFFISKMKPFCDFLLLSYLFFQSLFTSPSCWEPLNAATTTHKTLWNRELLTSWPLWLLLNKSGLWWMPVFPFPSLIIALRCWGLNSGLLHLITCHWQAWKCQNKPFQLRTSLFMPPVILIGVIVYAHL